MSSTSPAPPRRLSHASLASPPLHRITVDEYERIVAAGAPASVLLSRAPSSSPAKPCP
jgi:hypothetical protein